MGRIKKFFQKIDNKLNQIKDKGEPKWFWSELGEQGYKPTFWEFCKRGMLNTMIFLVTIALVIRISWWGVNSFLFELIKIYSESIGSNEVLYIFYGAVVGIGGSLIFGSVSNLKSSVASRIVTSTIYLGYFFFMFWFLNLILYVTILVRK